MQIPMTAEHYTSLVRCAVHLPFGSLSLDYCHALRGEALPSQITASLFPPLFGRYINLRSGRSEQLLRSSLRLTSRRYDRRTQLAKPLAAVLALSSCRTFPYCPELIFRNRKKDNLTYAQYQTTPPCIEVFYCRL